MFLNRFIKLVVIAGLLIALDQISKAVVLARIPLYASIPVIPGFFSLTHIQNPGGAFGLLAAYGSGWHRLALLGVSLGAIVLILYFYFKTPHSEPWMAFGLALILGGAAGNQIDRIRFGQVVDFLDFYIRDWHWPAFNMADSAITAGMIIFVFYLLFKKGRI